MRFPQGSPAYKELQRRLEKVRAANRDLTEAELDKKLYAVRAEYVREMRKKWGMPTDDWPRSPNLGTKLVSRGVMGF